MTEQFTVSHDKEIKLMRDHAKKWKRYKILTPVFYGYMIIGPVIWIGLYAAACYFWGGEFWNGIDLVVTPLILLWFIPLCLVNAMRISGGRDIFIARLNQQIVLNEEYFCNAWTPRFHEIEPAKFVEYRIAYTDIEKMDYNSELRRLEIYGKRNVFKDMGREEKHFEEKDEKPYIVYDYFEHMDELKGQLCKHTGLEINQI